MTQPRVAIVIVSFNSGFEIGGCLDAISKLGDVELADIETIVVDNASSDSTVPEVERRGVHLIANRENLGFAGAVNQGIRATQAPLILLLNPDTHILGGIGRLAARFEDDYIGAAGGLLLSPGGIPQQGFFARRLPAPAALIFEVLGINRIWPRNPINWQYRCLDLDPMLAQRIEQPAGAFLMLRRAAWERLGGFDERFWPVWFEDVDFCARLQTAGWSVWYEPKAVAVHKGAHSIRGLPVEKRKQYWYVSLLGYAGKHFHPFLFRIVCLAVAAGAVGRAITGFPRGRLTNLAVYGEVVRLAFRRFFAGGRNARLLLCDVRREIR